MLIETRKRTLLKTLSWRITATVTTILLVYLFTGQVETALAVGSIEVFAKMLIYYLHERGWEKLHFGRREVRPCVLWLTGPTGCGKGQVGEVVSKKLKSMGYKVEFINGHEIRELIPDIGFNKGDRIDHIKRVAYFVKKLEANGTFVVASFISPDAEARKFVRDTCSNFVEVYFSTPIEVCAQRENTGLYEKAKNGMIQNVCGIDFAYEKGSKPELEIDFTNNDEEKVTCKILSQVTSRI